MSASAGAEPLALTDDRRPIDLATAAPFRLGALEVRPSTRQVLTAGEAEALAEPRVLQVLLALAQAKGAVVSRDALIDRCWQGRIVGEDAINRSIGKARRLAELTDPPAFSIETIARVGHRLRLAEPLEASPVDPPGSGRWTSRRALIAAAATTGAGLLGYRLWPSAAKPFPLVAVLPFDNLSPDPQMGYFADGLAEDILNALVRLGGVRVTSSASSFTFRGPAKATAGRSLGADYLLDGSVMRDGARLRVNVRLDHVANRQTIWSETYDRPLGQALQVEAEVANQIAGALKVRLSPAPQAAPWVDPAAYDLYLRGREATRVHTRDSLQRGNGLLRAAVAGAPDFSAAWFELAKNYWRNGYLEPLPEQQRGFALGREAARKALALDARNGAVYGVLAEMTPAYGHWREIGGALARGLKVSPNDPNLVLWQGLFELQTGRLRAAAASLRRAHELDLFELHANHELCVALTWLGAFGEAEALAARMLAIWPDQIAGYWDRFWLLVGAGRDAEASAWLVDRARRPAGEAEEFAVLTETMAALRSPAPAARTAAARALTSLARRGLGYACNSMVLLPRLGQADAALELARSVYLRQGSLRIDRGVQFLGNSRYPLHGEAETGYLFHPFLAPLRRAGRLDPIFEGLGLTGFWRASGGPD